MLHGRDGRIRTSTLLVPNKCIGPYASSRKVRMAGVEPATSSTPCCCATGLRYILKVPPAGVDPAAVALRARCSTVELRRHYFNGYSANAWLRWPGLYLDGDGQSALFHPYPACIRSAVFQPRKYPRRESNSQSPDPKSGARPLRFEGIGASGGIRTRMTCHKVGSS